MTDPTVIVSVVAGIAAIIGSIFSFKASTRATAIESSKVDAEAYTRAKTIYQDALDEMEKQLERMRTQMDRVNAQLASEQDASNAMRTQIRTLRTHVEDLERTVADLRLQLTLQGIRQSGPGERKEES